MSLQWVPIRTRDGVESMAKASACGAYTIAKFVVMKREMFEARFRRDLLADCDSNDQAVAVCDQHAAERLALNETNEVAA